MNITVIGLGKLGSPLVTVLASKGHIVCGYDNNPEFVAKLDDGIAPVEETGLAELIALNADNISATTDIASACGEGTDIIFIVVPTPSQPDGSFSCETVVACVRDIARAVLLPGKLIVVVSTVMPGHCDKYIVPAIEEESGLTAGKDFGFCYSPEFIALGSVIHDTLRPGFVLIGESDDASGDKLEQLWDTVCENVPPVARMNYINAEIAKLSLNCFVTTKISYANMLAEICEQLPGADATVVADAIGFDKRIGHKYLAPGAAYGGPCFPRDNRAFCQMAVAAGAIADIPEATDRINRRQAERLTALACHACGDVGKVAVLGLTYKQHTCITEESAGITVANALIGRGLIVSAYDPRVFFDSLLDKRIHIKRSMALCVAEAEAVLIMTPWPEFATLQTDAITIDCWRIADPQKVPNLVTIGKHHG